eukprot:TRINITY_DN30415_c0_g1_i1.p1 TRINITY_DN30415_c0_g1~~TRINITY_DN30415_c0_g1_i1.p1  ORF type:complete len:107 (-),score=4.38 TRINITY_DN30415_c0_g1_i1:160-480(-)
MSTSAWNPANLFIANAAKEGVLFATGIPDITLYGSEGFGLALPINESTTIGTKIGFPVGGAHTYWMGLAPDGVTAYATAPTGYIMPDPWMWISRVTFTNTTQPTKF